MSACVEVFTLAPGLPVGVKVKTLPCSKVVSYAHWTFSKGKQSTGASYSFEK